LKADNREKTTFAPRTQPVPEELQIIFDFCFDAKNLDKPAMKTELPTRTLI
jgi:hypothetical protein